MFHTLIIIFFQSFMKRKHIKNIFLVAVFCLLTSMNALQAQWIQANGQGIGSVKCFAISGTNLFAGTNGGGVFLSNDNGTSWTPVNKGLSNTVVNALAVSDAGIFAGTNGGGVFLSNDNGTSWTSVNEGLTSTVVNALAVSDAGIFAGTPSGDVF